MTEVFTQGTREAAAAAKKRAKPGAKDAKATGHSADGTGDAAAKRDKAD